MKVVVLNGSPKGDVSVTMQYIAYVKKKFPGNTYEILNVAAEIKKTEADAARKDALIGSIKSADLVIWAFPLYFLLVSSQYKRFIELIFGMKEKEVFSGKYAISISTSINFFDQTAHAYIRGISDDLGMNYLGAYSAEMRDLLNVAERKRLETFASIIFSAVDGKIPVQRESAPVIASEFTYVPGTDPIPLDTGAKKIVILTDDDGRSANLTAMVQRLQKRFSGSAEVVNLHNLDIRGGCLGCCQCAFDNTCVYTDGYVDFYRNTLLASDIIILAGSVRDRYLSWTWKQFFDRSFFKGHTPGLSGKQVGFAISGPASQIPTLKEALSAWADNGSCNAYFVTDEPKESGNLDALLDAFAGRLLMASDMGYIPPHTFYAVGGHKIFRDAIYSGMRFVFQADYQYYRDHRMFDFPQSDLKTRCMNAVFIPLTKIPKFRKKMFNDLKHHMIRPFEKVLKTV